MSDYTKFRDRPRTLAKLTLAGYDDKTIAQMMHIARKTIPGLRRSKKFREAYAYFQNITDVAAVNLALARVSGLPTDVPERIIREFYGTGKPMSLRTRRRVTTPLTLQRERRAREQAALAAGDQDRHSAGQAQSQTPEDAETQGDNTEC